MHERQRARPLTVLQGTYYVGGGVWPLVHFASFEAVTGPKTDDWLVVTVGALLTAVGVALLVASRRAAHATHVAALGGGCAAALAFVDVRYVAGGTIAPIYLLDAVVEIAFVVAWMIAAWPRRA